MSEDRLRQEFGEERLSEFEIQLTGALRPVDAPEGFVARVMERAGTPTEAPAVSTKVVMMRPRWATVHVQAWVGGAIAAMLAVGAFVGEQAHVRHQREEAALANQQFDAALRVTDHAIAQTRAQLERAGLRLGN